MKLNMDLIHLHISEKIGECWEALANAPKNDYTVTFHHFVMSNAEILQYVKAAEFCRLVGADPSFKTEFTKMVKLGLYIKDHA